MAETMAMINASNSSVKPLSGRAHGTLTGLAPHTGRPQGRCAPRKRGGLKAILDRGHARRLGIVRPGRRNGPFQPNQETPMSWAGRSAEARGTFLPILNSDEATKVPLKGDL